MLVFNSLQITNNQQNIVVDFHQDFEARTHVNFVWGQVDRGLLYWLNHSGNTIVQTRRSWHVFWPQCLDASQLHYFANCWGSARNFKPTNQTSTNLLIKYHYNYSNYLLKIWFIFKLMTILSEGANKSICLTNFETLTNS